MKSEKGVNFQPVCLQHPGAWLLHRCASLGRPGAVFYK
ncbi:hypothetical protein L579_4018 [Pantoea sp. AS-PWVM4]|nr:hypothetical protein L579_4018 [Pantoea sp. AS-PWVM4]